MLASHVGNLEKALSGRALQELLTLRHCYSSNSLPGSSVHGILQVRILGWIAVSSSRGSSPPRDQNPEGRLSTDGTFAETRVLLRTSKHMFCVHGDSVYLRFVKKRV